MRNSNLFKNTFLFLIFFISSRSFSDDCLESVEFAKSFYREHAEFYSADPKYVKSLVTPKLYEILILNWECTIKNDGLCVDFSPWSSSNSIELGEPVSVISEPTQKNQIRVKFTFEYKWSEKSEPDVLTDYLLLKKEEGSCWKVNDLILTSGEYMSKIMRKAVLQQGIAPEEL